MVSPAIASQTDSGIAWTQCGSWSFGSEDPDKIVLTPTDDDFNGLGGGDNINGAGGNDCLFGSFGGDVLDGADGNDVVAGGPGPGGDVLLGGLGNDDIDATEGPGVSGLNGGDTTDAGAGDDDIKADDGYDDSIECGPGQDRVDADDIDSVAASCEQRVDLVGRVVYHGREWTGDPSTGGQLLAEEWVDTVTRSARREEPDWLATRGLVPCDDGQPYGPQCVELRERTTFSDTDPAQADTYYVQRGLSHNDPTVKNVAALLDETPPDSQANDRGPLSGALQSWQVAPAGAGTEYLKFDRIDFMSGGDPIDGSTGEDPEPSPT